MPGSPSPGGRKPGIRQIGQLVTRKGPEGSNPSPGAYFEEPSTSLKALAGESKLETTTAMDELTANNTKQNQITTIRFSFFFLSVPLLRLELCLFLTSDNSKRY